MQKLIKDLVLDTPLESVARFVLGRPKVAFKDSGSYWEERYARNGNSGVGSYGRLAKFKAKILNGMVEREKIHSVVEFGCGDGHQLTLANYPEYTGYDVSQNSIDLCKKLFAADHSKKFKHISDFNNEKSDLSLSLDVIYHLVEDDVYEKYMANLFMASSKFVVIYSSNFDDDLHNCSHVRHRKFTDWVEQNAPDFALLEKIPNEFPFDENRPINTSLADFYVFKAI